MSDQGVLYDMQMEARSRLLADDAEMARMLTREYAHVWRRIRMQIDTYSSKWKAAEQAAKASGKPMTAGERQAWHLEYDRLRQLQRQIEAEIRTFAQKAGDAVEAGQARAVTRSKIDTEGIWKFMEQNPPAEGVNVSFSRLPKQEFLQLVANTSPATPLGRLLNNLPGESQAVVDTLKTGLVSGWDTRTIASQIAEQGAIPLHRARTIARTETMRVYSDAAVEQFGANADVVDGWVWMAGLGQACCAACVAMHGTKHPVTERMHRHPNCRCIAAPIVTGYEDLAQVTPGEEWLRAQPEDTQRLVLGTDAGYSAWNNHEVPLSEFVELRKSEEWGPAIVQRSWRDVKARMEAA